MHARRRPCPAPAVPGLLLQGYADGLAWADENGYKV